MRHIEKAAIRLEDESVISVNRPLRHSDALLQAIMRGHLVDLDAVTCGFITSDGEFVDREAAAEIAHDADQIHQYPPKEELTTEHIW